MPLEVPSGLRRELSQVNANLYTAVTVWLRKHGKGIKPKLSDEQKQQLKECFELMDQDGSGAIDAEELGAAFKLLGIRMKKAELEELLSEVDHDGSGEVEYPEFLEIMTVTLQRLAEEEDSAKNEGQVPFALMATAYRRKRLMEGIIQGDKEVQAQIQQISDKANLEALRLTKNAEVDNLRGAGARTHSPAASNSPGRNLRRIGQLSIDQQLLSKLSPEERRMVGPISGRVGLGGARAPPPPVNLVGTMRAYQHFTDSPAHRQLVESPQLLDLRFMRTSTIKLPPGAATTRGSALSATMAGLERIEATRRGAGPSPGRMGAPRGEGYSGLLDMRYEGSHAYPSPKEPAGRTLGLAGAPGR